MSKTLNTPAEQPTRKEEEVLELIYEIGTPCAPKDVVARYAEPRPHVNTVATSFQSLERKGWLGHEQQGRTFLYTPTVPREQYGGGKIRNFVTRFFKGSFASAVSAFAKSEKLSQEEVEQLLASLSTTEEK
ncbi:MAG: BlaI/MecI/CopY family transcriptional regulator [Bacteroidaceae bacterium]|nr:BlaI/MecI/CopY family transcriptional regulator [Bacteroidaceae bacterium]